MPLEVLIAVCTRRAFYTPRWGAVAVYYAAYIQYIVVYVVHAALKYCDKAELYYRVVIVVGYHEFIVGINSSIAL